MSSYPPEHHVLRDLRFESQRFAVDRARAWIPLQTALCADDGSLRVGALAMMVDVAAASVALIAATPDWSATADLAYWTARPIVVGPLICESRLVRAGRGIIVIDADVYDGHGADEITTDRAGHARLSFSRIPASASAAAGRVDRSGAPTPRTTMSGPDAHFAAPLFDALGLRFGDDAVGHVECDKSDYVRNSFGTINGGVVCAIFEASAERAARASQCGAPLVARDLQVHFLAQTKVGPARATSRVLRQDQHHAVIESRLVDAGHNDTVLALATTSFGPVNQA